MRFLRLTSLIPGTKYRGQLEERTSSVIKEVEETADTHPALIYCHSLGELIDLEASVKGSYLPPALHDGKLRIVTAATDAELERAERSNPGLRPVSARCRCGLWIGTACSRGCTRCATATAPTTG